MSYYIFQYNAASKFNKSDLIFQLNWRKSPNIENLLKIEFSQLNWNACDFRY